VLDGYQMVGVGELVSISVAKSRWREGWDRALVGSMPKADRTWQQGVDLRGVVCIPYGASGDVERSRGRRCRPTLYIARIALFLVKAA
jgi:hypothetical protein